MTSTFDLVYIFINISCTNTVFLKTSFLYHFSPLFLCQNLSKVLSTAGVVAFSNQIWANNGNFHTFVVKNNTFFRTSGDFFAKSGPTSVKWQMQNTVYPSFLLIFHHIMNLWMFLTDNVNKQWVRRTSVWEAIENHPKVFDTAIVLHTHGDCTKKPVPQVLQLITQGSAKFMKILNYLFRQGLSV
jgi:hypothetical protein